MSSGQSVDARVRRGGTPKDLAELFRRVEELERVPPFEPGPEVVYSLAGPRGIIVSVTAHPTTGDLSEPLDWTSGVSNSITSNDEQFGPITGDMDARADPFTGHCYVVDWGSAPTDALTIIRQGVYHIHAYWTFGITPPPGYPTMPPYTQAAFINGVAISAIVSRYVPDQTFWQDQWAGPPALDQTKIYAISDADESLGFNIQLGAFTDMDGWSGMQAFLEVWRLGDWEGLETDVGS